MIKENEKKIKELNEELDLKIQVIKLAGSEAIWQVIYYNHSKEVKINWQKNNQLPEETVTLLKEKLVLPEGVTFK